MGRAVLDANPNLQLHHMADPNQDALMTRWMSYFRCKYLTLPSAYKTFLLQPGGTILVVECRYTYNAVRMGDRFYFQPGAFGGITPDQYVQPNAEVDRFIRDEVLHLTPTQSATVGEGTLLHWNAPQPDCQAPEAEWGFAGAMCDDIERFAAEHGFGVQRLLFDEPQQLSEAVADLYRDWYRRVRGIEAVPNHLFCESFVLTEPWWVLRTGSVPFWGVFPIESTAAAIEQYLVKCKRRGRAYRSASTTLLSHGVRSVGYAPVSRWLSALRAGGSEERQNLVQMVGVDVRRFPMDFQALVRYNQQARAVAQTRYMLPMKPLQYAELEAFMSARCQHIKGDMSGAPAGKSRQPWHIVVT